MSNAPFVKPRLTVLTPTQIEQVQEYSLEILSTTGIRVDSESARNLFAQKVGASALRDGRVYLPRETVEWAIQCAPSSVNIYDRLGNLAFRLGADRTRFGIGVTNLYYQEPESDNVVPFARKHMEICVRLGNALPHYDVVSTIGILQDMPPNIADLYAVLEMVANTTKPLVILVSKAELFPTVLELLEHLQGDLSARPSVIPYFNPITPLIINRETVDKMFASIDRGLPIIYSNYSMAGMSTPITASGTLALLNAELLAGLVLSQLYKEGAPVIMGSLPAFFDMKTMVDFFDPHTILLNLACAEMMTHYGLPHAGTSGSHAGWGPDLPEAGMLWLNHLTGCIGDAGLAPFVGSTLGSMVFSPVTAIYAHDIIGQALHFAQGFAMDEQSVGLDEIAQVGPGGDFLASNLTLRHFRYAYYKSDIYPNMSLDKWQSLASPRSIDYLRDHARRLMDSAKPPDDYAELIAKGEAYIEQGFA